MCILALFIVDSRSSDDDLAAEPGLERFRFVIFAVGSQVWLKKRGAWIAHRLIKISSTTTRTKVVQVIWIRILWRVGKKFLEYLSTGI